MKKIFLFLALFIGYLTLQAQTVLTIENQSIVNTDPEWDGYNVPHNVKTTLTFRNNAITSVNTSMYLLQAGDDYEATTINNLDGAQIYGNKLTWNGTQTGSIITHGLFVGYNINQTVKWNSLTNCPYNIIFKSGGTANPNMNITAGGASYNIVKGGRFAGRCKGINGARFYNNTFYGDAGSWYLLLINANTDGAPTYPGNPSINTKVKNNIFYTTTKTASINIDAGSRTGFECDYNVYWCEAGDHEPIFTVNGTSYTWTQWRALGYDAHSVVVNPNFNNTTAFVPATRLNYGTDLGTEFNTGLSTSATWVVGTTPATQVQNGAWQVGARIFAPTAPTPYLTLSTNTLTIPSTSNSTGTFTISSNTTWNVSSSSTWLTPSTTSGSGNATITLTAQANTNSTTRTATITVTGTNVSSQTVTVTQQGSTPTQSIYYLSPNGNDVSGNGTITSPWFTINKAWTVVKPGDVVYMRGGTYQYSNEQVLTGKNGTIVATIKIMPYQNEKPIMSPSSTFFTNGNNDGIVIRDCEYIEINGIEITGYIQPRPDDWGNGIVATDVRNCVFENLNIHHGCFGLVMGNDDGITHNNLILNCDFHHNSDPITNFPPPYTDLFAYGNADGLTIRVDGTLGIGTTNYIIGCRMWYNSDDGIDLWSNEGTIVIKDSWAFLNGYNFDTTIKGPGDGNGFKLGRTYIENSTQVLRKVYNCISYMNSGWGFVRNGAMCNMEIYNNTAYRNGTSGTWSGGYFFGEDGSYTIPLPFYVKNNVAYQNVTNATVTVTTNANHNSWDSNVTITDFDFLNLSSAELTNSRLPDGSLPYINFLRLAAGSDLINAGVDVGIPYKGLYPDLGAFEFDEELEPIFQIIVSKGFTIKSGGDIIISSTK